MQMYANVHLHTRFFYVHLHTRTVIQGQRGILHSRFRIKHFMCNQRDRNYIFSLLIKIKQKQTAVKHTLPMRILQYFN